MTQIKDIIAYFCDRYPAPDDLSAARLTKMVYLADWKAAIDLGRQLTSIHWYYNEYGPYVSDVMHAAAAHPSDFRIDNSRNLRGNPKRIVSAVSPYEPRLPEDDRRILDHVIRTTRDLSWSEFIRLVYSTYPILAKTKHSDLDLLELAARYKQEREAIRAAGARHESSRRAVPA